MKTDISGKDLKWDVLSNPFFDWRPIIFRIGIEILIVLQSMSKRKYLAILKL